MQHVLGPRSVGPELGEESLGGDLEVGVGHDRPVYHRCRSQDNLPDDRPTRTPPIDPCDSELSSVEAAVLMRVSMACRSVDRGAEAMWRYYISFRCVSTT